MIKRTLFLGNPAYLSSRNEQMIIQFPDSADNDVTIPIEDIGYLVLEHPQITITNGLIMRLINNKAAVITCDNQHLPCSFLQPLIGHTEQTERIRDQLKASLPLKKQLWQQTVVAKITNQANHLQIRSKNHLKLTRWSKKVKSGDTANHEALAAAYYFQHLFDDIEGFNRNPKGIPPNNLLNYGYAILRAIAARALVSTGLLLSVGIHHKNKYNPFCLVDDIMEPYRPFVDAVVFDITETGHNFEVLTTGIKAQLLSIPAIDTTIDNKKSPLMNAMSRTTNSLYECFSGRSRRLLYPLI